MRPVAETEIDVPDELVALDARRFYGGKKYPPGGEAVEERVLARMVVPGTTRIAHGVVPIASLMLPSGNVLPELDDDADTVEVLPFRLVGGSTTFALRYGDRFYAIIKVLQPQQVVAGMLACVHMNDNRNWDGCVGKVKRVGLSFLVFERPNGDQVQLNFTDVHFVGKVAYWWMDGAAGEMWVDVDESATSRETLGIDETGKITAGIYRRPLKGDEPPEEIGGGRMV